MTIKAKLKGKQDSISVEETKKGSLNLYLPWIMEAQWSLLVVRFFSAPRIVLCNELGWG